MPHTLTTLGFLAVLFLALPWLAVAFNRYCDAVNRWLARKQR
ncbi:hypothetical protein ACFYU4_37830 [Streptomyces tendae]